MSTACCLKFLWAQGIKKLLHSKYGFLCRSFWIRSLHSWLIRFNVYQTYMLIPVMLMSFCVKKYLGCQKKILISLQPLKDTLEFFGGQNHQRVFLVGTPAFLTFSTDNTSIWMRVGIFSGPARIYTTSALSSGFVFGDIWKMSPLTLYSNSLWILDIIWYFYSNVCFSILLT